MTLLLAGFISIDCGIDPSENYTGETYGIRYVSDDGFVEGGENFRLSNSTNNPQLDTLRSFPEHNRSCYTLRPQQGKNNRYLIRARFLYGNYDNKPQNPQFDLHLGTDYWATVIIRETRGEYIHEIIHLATSDYINVCLINTGHGNPFISTLDLRLLDITMYEGQFQSLNLLSRHNFGTNEVVRYNNDIYDRIWYPLPISGCRSIQNSTLVSSGPSDDEKVPLKVMRNAVTPIDSDDNLMYRWGGDTADDFIIYIHLAEVEILKSNQTREFNIYLGGNDLFGPISPSTSITTLTNKSPFTGSSSYKLNFNQTQNSNLPPMYNAIEIYTGKQLLQNQTEERDAFAIGNTNYKNPNAAKDTCLCNTSLTSSQSKCFLDLSYYNLGGTVPQFLASLDNLKLLNLTGNNFTRPLPAELLAKSKKRSLFLSIEESGDQDKGYCLNGSCKGGFGTVFRGSIGDNQVAVKILSESSSQGYKEFQAEVKLLMDIRHKNITSLVGYCNDSNHKAIIYEYMANGNLEQHLFDENSNVLSWERRLQIGCDAAEG
ncbi:leucine-rich repeat transmembrane protein kinase protein [Tanacetum coccineum]